MKIHIRPSAAVMDSFVLRLCPALAVGPTQRVPVTSQHTPTMREPTLGASVSTTWQTSGYKPTFIAPEGSFNYMPEPQEY